MKKRLSHFPYNERSRPGWTPSTSLRKPLSPIRSTMKTVTYVPGTFVTLVPGPYKRGIKGDFFEEVKPSMTAEISHGPSFPKRGNSNLPATHVRGATISLLESKVMSLFS